MKNGFFDSHSGNRSSSRLIGFIVVIVALVFAQEVLYVGREDVISAAAAAGTIFITIAAPAMAFLFAQKRTEATNNQQQQQHQKNNTKQNTENETNIFDDFA